MLTTMQALLQLANTGCRCGGESAWPDGKPTDGQVGGQLKKRPAAASSSCTEDAVCMGMLYGHAVTQNSLGNVAVRVCFPSFKICYKMERAAKGTS